MRKTLIAGIAVGVAVLAGAPAASAETTGVGWWTRSPVASAPEGGIAVGNAPDGPLSVAAVAVDLGDGVSSASLSLNQTGGSAPPAGQLVACVIGGGFESAAGAPIEEAPATACDTTSVVVAASGTTWSADLRELIGERQGLAGIAIVPAAGSSSLWDLQFEAPTFTSTPAPSSSSDRTTATTAAPRTSPTTVARAAPTPVAPSFDVSRPPTVAAPVTTTTVAASDTASDIAAAIPNLDTSGGSTFSGDAGDGDPEGRPIGQAITMLVLAVVVGIGAGVAHRVVTTRLSI